MREWQRVEEQGRTTLRDTQSSSQMLQQMAVKVKPGMQINLGLPQPGHNFLLSFKRQPFPCNSIPTPKPENRKVTRLEGE